MQTNVPPAADLHGAIVTGAPFSEPVEVLLSFDEGRDIRLLVRSIDCLRTDSVGVTRQQMASLRVQTKAAYFSADGSRPPVEEAVIDRLFERNAADVMPADSELSNVELSARLRLVLEQWRTVTLVLIGSARDLNSFTCRWCGASKEVPHVPSCAVSVLDRATAVSTNGSLKRP